METFSPVERHDAICVILALATYEDIGRIYGDDAVLHQNGVFVWLSLRGRIHEDTRRR